MIARKNQNELLRSFFLDLCDLEMLNILKISTCTGIIRMIWYFPTCDLESRELLVRKIDFSFLSILITRHILLVIHEKCNPSAVQFQHSLDAL